MLDDLWQLAYLVSGLPSKSGLRSSLEPRPLFFAFFRVGEGFAGWGCKPVPDHSR